MTRILQTPTMWGKAAEVLSVGSKFFWEKDSVHIRHRLWAFSYIYEGSRYQSRDSVSLAEEHVPTFTQNPTVSHFRYIGIIV